MLSILGSQLAFRWAGPLPARTRVGQLRAAPAPPAPSPGHPCVSARRCRRPALPRPAARPPRWPRRPSSSPSPPRSKVQLENGLQLAGARQAPGGALRPCRRRVARWQARRAPRPHPATQPPISRPPSPGLSDVIRERFVHSRALQEAQAELELKVMRSGVGWGGSAALQAAEARAERDAAAAVGSSRLSCHVSLARAGPHALPARR